jgi:hypothetical protein
MIKMKSLLKHESNKKFIIDLKKLLRSDKRIYRCPRVAKKFHNLFAIKDINFFFFLDDIYASTAYSENIAVYTGCPRTAA